MPAKRDDEPAKALDWVEALAALDGSGQDIEAVAFTVLMAAAKSAQEDLKAIMAQVKAINATKQHLRELLAKVNRDVTAALVADAEGRALELSERGLGGKRAYTRAKIAIPDPESPGGMQFAVVALVDGPLTSRCQLENARDALQGRLDSMSEMGEMESLRLQMAMDRVSKMMSTLSNVLKKISDTNRAITQNIK
jgi:hypothetical protein